MMLTYTEISLLSLSAFLLGISKAGLKGVDLLNFVIFAFLFGSKSSTGIVLPLLVFADVMASLTYRRDANWAMIKRLIGWIIIGILCGVVIGKDMNEAVFKKLMAVIILVTVAIVYLIEIKKKEIISEKPVVSIISGVITGFTSMIGNLAGAFANLYFLSLRINKAEFIGTTAVLFLLVNLIKLPFQIFYWHNITLETVKIDLYAIPALVIGFLVGKPLVAKIADDTYRKFVLIVTLIGAIIMLLR
jgi:uncharacterized protein